jgi:hypothetical protein
VRVPISIPVYTTLIENEKDKEKEKIRKGKN